MLDIIGKLEKYGYSENSILEINQKENLIIKSVTND